VSAEINIYMSSSHLPLNIHFNQLHAKCDKINLNFYNKWIDAEYNPKIVTCTPQNFLSRVVITTNVNFSMGSD